MTLRSVLFICGAVFIPSTTLAGAPSIEFTSIPPYGTTQLLQGRVRNASPDSFVVAPYIFVEGSGWWTKPFFDPPIVPIQADSTWSTTITTGGSDIYATRICVFLIPTGVTPPQCPSPIDDCACLPSSLDTVAVAEACTTRAARSIQFAGIEWWKKASVGRAGPGGNYFCDDSTNVFVDAQGRLHLKITRRGTQYSRYSCASEVISTVSFGYGRYRWKLSSPVGALDQNAVLGLFTWDNDACDEFFRELDIEFSRWGVATDPNAQYVVAPHYETGNRNRWSIPEDVVLSTHSLEWQPDRIVFRSWRGHSNQPPPDSLIFSWVYTGTRIPSPGTLKPRINLWLYGADSTSDGSDVEVIISEFFGDTPTPVIGVDGPRVTLVDFLAPARPNPASGSTVIEFGLPVEQDQVALRLYDVSGRVVRTLFDSQLHAGVFRQTWDLRNDAGSRVPAGMYFYRLSTGSFKAVRKLIVLE